MKATHLLCGAEALNAFENQPPIPLQNRPHFAIDIAIPFTYDNSCDIIYCVCLCIYLNTDIK